MSLELITFKQKRIAAFRKNLIEMTELEIKHAKVSDLLKWISIAQLQWSILLASTIDGRTCFPFFEARKLNAQSES